MQIDVDALVSAYQDVEFFLICVAPKSEPVFNGSRTGKLSIIQTKNFWSITSTVSETGKGLITLCATGHVLFRGYDSDLGIHSYSDSASIALLNPGALSNGVYAYIQLDNTDQTAIVKNDPLGLAPLFYRKADSGYFFASHPALIHFADDELDLLAWMSMLQNGLVAGDRSFYKPIHRVSAGTELKISGGLLHERTWFDFSELPPGNEAIDDIAFDVVEKAYVTGFEKLLALETASRTLPFSSGYDSRRFFASMIQRKVNFHAVTCQTFHRKKGKDYDIDSFYAPQIAGAFGVACELVLASLPKDYAADSAHRMALIGTETFMHGWAVPLMKWLADRPMSIVFDGLGGDTLGNSGYEFDGLHISAKNDTAILMSEMIDNRIFDHVSKLFPSLKEFSSAYSAQLGKFPDNLNGAEMAFLQSRTRRCISPWITMMHPPGQLVVFPYYDLGFVRATLRYHPGEKYKWFFQKECLRRFYPDYFDHPGSRNLPADIIPLSEEKSKILDKQAENFVFGSFSVVAGALKFLTLKNKALLLLLFAFSPLRKTRNWLFFPLLLLVKTHQGNIAFIKQTD